MAILLLIFFISLNAQNSSLISGELKSISTEKTSITVNRYNGYSYILYESVQVSADGKFQFGKILDEGFYQLSIPSQSVIRPFYATGKNAIHVSVESTEFETGKAQFSDEENKALTEMLDASKHLELTLNSLSEKFDPRQLDSFYYEKIGPYNQLTQMAYRNFNTELQKLRTKYPNTITMQLFSCFYQLPLFDEDATNSKNYDNQDAYMRDHFFDNWKLDDPRITCLPEIKTKLEKYFRYFARKNHAFLLKKCDEITAGAKTEKIKSYLGSLLIDFFTQVKENDVVAHVVEKNMNGCLDDIDLSLINFTSNNLRGTKVSELELPGQNLQPVKLSSVYSTTKMTVLYFYFTDCMHCRNFHPIMKTLKEKYGKNLAVYSVCLEDDEKKWRDAITEFALPFNNVIASGDTRKKIKQLFNIKYTPTIYVLDAAGEIVDKDLSSEDVGDALSRLMR